LYNFGNACLSLKQPASAIPQFRKALDAQPDFPEASIGLGVALMQSGDLDGAEAAFVKFVAQKPDNADARFNLANILFNKGQYGLAADSYHEAIRLRPEFAQ